MNKCSDCHIRKAVAKAYDMHWHGEIDCPFRRCPIQTPKTNADHIRAMTDEELVFFFWGTVDGSGKTVEQWREWLKQEAKE